MCGYSILYPIKPVWGLDLDLDHKHEKETKPTSEPKLGLSSGPTGAYMPILFQFYGLISIDSISPDSR